MITREVCGGVLRGVLGIVYFLRGKNVAPAIPCSHLRFLSPHRLYLRCCTMSETKEAPDHEVIILTPDQKLLRQQCYDVRTEIFHHEQGFPLDTEIDQCVTSRQFHGVWI